MKAVSSWSGGKDSAVAVEKANVTVEELLVTYGDDGRTSMHGLRPEAVEAQAAAMDVELNAVTVPEDDEGYSRTMDEVTSEYASRGFSGVVFGDIYLEDVRSYREDNLDALDGVWPLWGRNTAELAEDVVESYSAVVVCAKNELSDLVGREFDRSLIENLPEDVDPLGENGGFHTYVYDAPRFDGSVDFDLGAHVEKTLGDGSTYHYVDVEV